MLVQGGMRQEEEFLARRGLPANAAARDTERHNADGGERDKTSQRDVHGAHRSRRG
jgi:hypothetical protein